MRRPTMPGPDRHVLVRDGGTMTLRIDTGRVFRSGSQPPTFATVEWAGRAGHPSSYALLGGTRSDTAAIRLFDTGASFDEALANSVDDVHWGLPVEYEEAVLAVLVAAPQPVLVSRAAHATIGSSAHAFRAVALLLSQILAAGLPDSDQDVWKLGDRCWNESV